MASQIDNPRKIIHIDLDAFFCAVEEKYNPSLKGKPFAVGGSPEGRGVVASCSYAARRYGVRSAMPMARALRLCPDLIVVRSAHRKYAEESRKVMAILRQVTELVEQLSIDEAFLDVTDNELSPELIAHQVQTRVRKELGLPCSLGVASNKLVAKIATDVGKLGASGDEPPNALTIVPPGTEAEFLAPLPVEMLWGVGPKTAEKLDALGALTIGDLAKIPELELVKRFGKHGWDLARKAKGIDNRPIVTFREAKSVSHETTFPRDITDKTLLKERLKTLCQRVSRRLTKQSQQGRTVKLKLRWSDFTTITRQMSLLHHTADESEIFEVACRLLDEAWDAKKPVRLIGVGVSALEKQPRQLWLWDYRPEDEQKHQQLLDAVKVLNERFGRSIVSIGYPGGEKEMKEDNQTDG